MTSFLPAYHQLSSTRIDPDHDAETVHRWLTHPKARYWDSLDHSLADVRQMLVENASAAGDSVYGMRIGSFADKPEFLFELYDPNTSELAAPTTGYVHADGDIGMHLLVAHTDNPQPGFTGAVMLHIMRIAFLEIQARRVVVEPDVRNSAVHRLNAAVGFHVAGDYPVGNKIARLSYCTRLDFIHATDGGQRLAATPLTQRTEELR
ncbi:MAG: GNAT family N-acetyltransferase [Gordonia sp. (in: high G+C Gram-positive bacteria)]